MAVSLKQLGLVTGVKCTNDTSKQIIYIKSKPSTKWKANDVVERTYLILIYIKES